MATKPLTTTYNELEKLGACKEGLEMLWAWLCKTNHVRGDDPIDASIMRNQYLTPADILESNGVEHLDWAASTIPSWNKSWREWLASGGRSVPEWAKKVSQPYEKKVLAKDLKKGDRILVGGATGVVSRHYSDTNAILWCARGGDSNTFLHAALDAIGFTLLEPKREPRRLKAEQILVPENVGTKWARAGRTGVVAKVVNSWDDTSSPFCLEWVSLWPGVSVPISHFNLTCLWEEVLE